MSRASSPPPNSHGWHTVNRPEQQTLIDATSCCLPVSAEERNPIDAFYGSIGEVLRLGEPSALNENETLGRLLILGIVTVTEAYFRSIIAATVKLCPLAYESASDQQIAYGALGYYGSSEVGLGLLEGVSFTSTTEVRKATNSILGIDINTDKSLLAALDAYNQVCSMRHAVVHDHGRINRGNARVLDVRPRTGRFLRLVVNLPNLHTAASACTSAVRAYNGFIWKSSMQRWINGRVLRGSWDIDKEIFEPMFKLFRSATDDVGPSNAYHAYLSIRPALARRLASQT